MTRSIIVTIDCADYTCQNCFAINRKKSKCLIYGSHLFPIHDTFRRCDTCEKGERIFKKLRSMI